MGRGDQGVRCPSRVTAESRYPQRSSEGSRVSFVALAISLTCRGFIRHREEAGLIEAIPARDCSSEIARKAPSDRAQLVWGLGTAGRTSRSDQVTHSGNLIVPAPGGTGRRAWFRSMCRKPPHSTHRSPITILNSKAPLFFSSWLFALIAASDGLKRPPSCSTGPRPSWPFLARAPGSRSRRPDAVSS
jgi:hypothetical protein